MRQNKIQGPWIVCGVIALVGVCVLITVAGGVGLYATMGGQQQALTSATAVTQTLRAHPAQNQPTTPARQQASTGDIAGIPYKAVVQIVAYVKLHNRVEQGWTGSGSIISPDGLILTNAHVVLSDRYYQVDHLVVSLTNQPDEQPVPTYIAEVLQVDQELDVAVIRVDKDLGGNPVDRASLNLPTVQLGDSDALNLGDPLTILGYPSIGGSTITLTRGEVAGFTAEDKYGHRAFIKTSATISGGNSGGLATNGLGQMIGIPTQLGYGGKDQYVDCRVLVDTNRDGVVDNKDSCVPTGGFINALRPLTLAKPYIEAARRGEVNIKEGVQGQQGEAPGEPGNTVLFSDDFSDPASGWEEKNWAAGEVAYRDGEYQMTVKNDKWLLWSNLDQDQADLIISVDTRVVSPTGAGDYGVMCHYQDEKNFYALEVSEDGYFSIWKEVDGEMTPIYDWTFSDAIPAGQPFRIDAGCVGNRLLLGVNDTLLADITDDSFSSGLYGLIAGTLDTGGLTVGMDNFTVYKP